jgi:hypothetical protein
MANEQTSEQQHKKARLKELMEDTTEQQHNVDAAYPQ